ncbi:hypothetical protein, conserved [Eimeria necatrix]|uniref:Uncharacterized protein n=1 Tax=Eimeria necatrix TaxID=51315 RepID=U6MLD7_9EIME|nr:hypothetical protein, conserved [Eimeria necatrix]CDJ62475.1 hypothetical protein, conserved [Eimeria necatrix]
MWERHWMVCRGLFLATCCVAFTGVMLPSIALAVGERKKRDTAPSPAPVVNLHVDLPNTDKFNAKASLVRTRELQDIVNTGQRKFEEDIFGNLNLSLNLNLSSELELELTGAHAGNLLATDFQQIIQQQVCKT